MGIELQLDTRELRSAMQLYARATKKDEADILNRAAFNIIYGSFGKGESRKNYGVFYNCPITTRDVIEKDLFWSENGGGTPMVIKLAAKQLKGTQANLGADARKKRGGVKAAYRWQKRVGKQAKAILSSRKRGIGFMKFAWVQAARAAGLSGAKGSPGSTTASKGFGFKAAANRLVAEIGQVISAKDASEKKRLGMPSLQKAVNGTARDMADYANKQLEKTARQYSAKGAAIAKSFR